MSPSGPLPWLLDRGLLRTDAVPEPRASVEAPHPSSLLRLCDAGALEGGLSVALDVRPDELFGPLCARLGGGAKALRVTDVREGPPFCLEVTLGAAAAGRVERWEVAGIEALIDRLGEALAPDPKARAVALLGEHNDMWQLWCVAKSDLFALRAEPWFAPQNRGALLARRSHPQS